jgi:hypothetical protein
VVTLVGLGLTLVNNFRIGEKWWKRRANNREKRETGRGREKPDVGMAPGRQEVGARSEP